jgi:hypothetical protein
VSSGLPDFRTPVDIAASILLSASVDIVAQTLSALNTDYRYGTATESAATEDLDGDENIILTISGKGIIKGGFFEFDSNFTGDLPDVNHKIIYRLDGEDHDFDYIETMTKRQFGNATTYFPSITRISNDQGLISGLFPGDISFEESFSLVIDSAGAGKTNSIKASVFYAVSLS